MFLKPQINTLNYCFLLLLQNMGKLLACVDKCRLVFLCFGGFFLQKQQISIIKISINSTHFYLQQSSFCSYKKNASLSVFQIVGLILRKHNNNWDLLIL